MGLAAGTRLGPYEIVAPLGAGGMGEVYRARDTRLGREVALKVLPPLFARDSERMARFEREARLLASLHHPHIATLFGVEDSGEIFALAMELVEGPTLAERIAPGAMPLDEVLRIGRQIAEALEAAHERGVIHRDLKPANIKLTTDGEVKVLDFGLAKALDSDPASGSGSEAQTLIIDSTRTGVILGTAAYMSPEQAKGKTVDRRADIWAFGVVLYEMLAGQRLFRGETSADTLAAVLTKDPAIDTQLASAPAPIRRLLRRCLERDPKKRLRDIGEARIAIDEFLSEPQADAAPATAAPIAGPAKRPLAWMVLAASMAALAAGLGFVWLRQAPPAERVLRYSIPAPERSSIHSIALSADGRRLAIAATTNGKNQIWLRDLESIEAQVLPGTDDAQFPFWSPDGKWIGYFAQERLKKIAVGGGAAQTLCDAPGGSGGTWNRDGVIVFSAPKIGLQRVSAAGGLPAAITKGDPAGNPLFPVFLPDGRRFLFVSDTESGQGVVYVGSLDGQSPRKLFDQLSPLAYVPAQAGSKVGHVLFLRESTLLAQPVDERSMRIAGELFPVAEQIFFKVYAGFAPFSASSDGVLVFQAAGNVAANQLTWMDRAGKPLAKVGEPTREVGFVLSPDESMVAMWRSTSLKTSDIWLHDLARGADTRLTFDASLNVMPVWSPDGRRIAFSSKRTGNYDIYVKDVSGGGQDEPILQSSQYKIMCDWSRDGRFLLFAVFKKTDPDLWVVPVEGERKAVPFLATEFVETQGQFSPDSRWIAYQSDESGRPEIYVRPFPAAPGKWQISVGGGILPRWRGDGKELYYLSRDLKLMAAPLKAPAGARQALETGVPQELFDTHGVTPPRNVNAFMYAPSADGQRFLVNVSGSQPYEAPLTVVVNWLAAVKR
jgi:Tol biopolymer transport system component